MQDRSPPPGPQQPGKYPVAVGPKYTHYGEQAGWVYNPYTDEYVPDPKTSKEWGESVGLVEKEEEPPGFIEQAAPVGGALAMGYLGKEIAKGGVDYVSGMMGKEAGKEVAKGAAQEAASGASGSGAGMMGGAPTPPASGMAPATATQGQAPGMMSGAGAMSTNPTVVNTLPGGDVLLSDGSISTPIGSAADGGVMLEGGGTANVAQTGTTAATDFGAASTLGQAGLIAGGVLGTIGMHDLVTENTTTRSPKHTGMSFLQGASSGAGMGAAAGSVIPGAGTVIGGVVGGIVGGVAGIVRSLWKSGKHGDQMKRDAMRDGLAESGLAEVIDGSHHITLADGTKFDIGLDGDSMIQGAAGKVNPYNADPDNPLGAQAFGWATMLSNVLTDGGDKASSDLGGYLANGAMSNAEDMEGVRQNLLAFAQKMNASSDNLSQEITKLHEAGKITDEEHAAMINSIGTLYKGDPNLYVHGSVRDILKDDPDSVFYEGGDSEQAAPETSTETSQQEEDEVNRSLRKISM